jgi:hypothetical protein
VPHYDAAFSSFQPLHRDKLCDEDVYTYVFESKSVTLTSFLILTALSVMPSMTAIFRVFYVTGDLCKET